MLMSSLTSIWPVLTPKGTVGSTTTFAPRSHARRADSAAMWSHWITSVAYGR